MPRSFHDITFDELMSRHRPATKTRNERHDMPPEDQPPRGTLRNREQRAADRRRIREAKRGQT